MTFSVIDKRTGKAPIFDHNHIFKEKWFKNSGLIYCDIDGWYIGEDGELVLIDDCGNAGYPPIDRFEVVFDEEPKQGELGEFFKAFPELDIEPYNTWNCGASMRVKDELNRVSKELNSKTEYKAKVKELENAIAKCEKAEEEFKKRTCKFKSPTNCDFCSFHSDCDEHWKEGDEK